MLFRKSNKALDREKVVETLVSARHQRPVPAGRERSDLGRRIVERTGDAQHELMVELYLSHFTNQQLRALWDFYRSEVGLSIIETDRQINEEFQQELRARMETIGREVEAEVEAERNTRTQGARMKGILLRSYPKLGEEE